MLNWLKNHFIPHDGNNHKPHFFSHEVMFPIFIFIIFVEIFLIAGHELTLKNDNLLGAVLPAVLTDLTNENRLDNDLPVLKENSLLDEAAQMKAEDMASKGYFSHNTPDGKTPWYWLDQVGYDYSYAGENLAVNFFESSDVAQAWMNSPSHRENIVREEFTEIGIGVASGVYQGRDTIFVAQFFGTPAAVSNTEEEVILTVNDNKSKEIENSIESNETESKIIPVETKVLGEEISVKDEIQNTKSISDEEDNLSLWEKIISSPREYALYIFLTIAIFISFIIIIILFVKREIRHPLILARGFFLVVFIIVLSYFNLKILGSKTLVPTDSNSTSIANVIAN